MGMALLAWGNSKCGKNGVVCLWVAPEGDAWLTLDSWATRAGIVSRSPSTLLLGRDRHGPRIKEPR